MREVVLLHEQTAELVRHVHGRRKCHAGVPVGVVGGHDAVVRRVGCRADNRAADRNQIAVSGELELPVRRQADDAVGVEDGIGTLCHQREIALDVDVRRRHVRHGPEVAVAVDEEGGAFGVLQHVHPAGEGAFRHIGAASILQIGMGRAVGSNGHAAVAGAAFKQHAHELVPLRDPSARPQHDPISDIAGSGRVSRINRPLVVARETLDVAAVHVDLAVVVEVEIVEIGDPQDAAGRHVEAKQVLLVRRRRRLRRQHEVLALEQSTVSDVDDALRLHNDIRRVPAVVVAVGRTQERCVLDRHVGDVHVHACSRHARAHAHRQSVLERHAHGRVDRLLPEPAIRDA